MKKWRIHYRPHYKSSPISFWVHKHMGEDAWCHATKFDPPLPKAIPCKGFPFLVINALGTELEFSSVLEAEHFLDVISQKNMPTTGQLSRQRCDTYGPNTHWLSRLPSYLKPWVKRQKIIPIIEEGLEAFKAISR